MKVVIKYIKVKDSKKGINNPHELLKGKHNLMRFPFGLKEKRFRWQTSSNIGESYELRGTLTNKNSDIMNTSAPNWESFLNRTSDNNENRRALFSSKYKQYILLN